MKTKKIAGVSINVDTPPTKTQLFKLASKVGFGTKEQINKAINDSKLFIGTGKKAKPSLTDGQPDSGDRHIDTAE